MTTLTETAVQDIQWFAVRMRPRPNGGTKTAIIDVEKEQYVNRAGLRAYRKVKGTGRRVFLPEHVLKRAGFEVFLPVKKVWRTKNRFTKEKHLVSVPLLADWMFVGWELGSGAREEGAPSWKVLMELDVVAGVMGTGGRPIQMSDKAMMRLMRQFGGKHVPSVVKRRLAAKRKFGSGDVARVIDGPLEGQDVRIVEISGPSAKAVLNILGGDVEVEIDSEVLG
jgi:transcription antitermination factor NusG